MGFDAEWGVLGAADVGAKHKRNRIWIVAHSSNIGLQGNIQKQQISKQKNSIPGLGQWEKLHNTLSKPIGIRSLNGLAGGVDRLKAIGNGQVPLCAATAFNILKKRLENGKH
jgi:DNA (cytosine-5)-methyltransferase 1